MIFNAIDQKIRTAFTDASMQYDMLTSLHKEIGRELSRKFTSLPDCTAILDIGMGTGWYTKRVKFFFPEALVVGCDFSHGMLLQAKQNEGDFHIIEADAKQLPFKDNTFDVITSNLAFQWVEDLAQSYKHCYEQLNDKGILCFTMFGRETFCEMFEALDHCRDDDQKRNELPISRLSDCAMVEQALEEAGFKQIKVDAERIKVRFNGMMDIIKWAKSIGANALPRDMYIGKEYLQRTCDYYDNHYRDRLGVYTTFEVIWIEAKK